MLFRAILKSPAMRALRSLVRYIRSDESDPDYAFLLKNNEYHASVAHKTPIIVFLLLRSIIVISPLSKTKISLYIIVRRIRFRVSAVSFIRFRRRFSSVKFIF